MIRLVILGAGGHARVLIDAARSRQDVEVMGLLQPDGKGSPIDGVQVIGSDDDLASVKVRGATHAIVGVAGLRPGELRSRLFERILASGLEPAVIVHRDATVSPHATIGPGSMVFARAVINPGTRIGRNVIINTAALIEHDCVIEDHAHVLPGATVGGAVGIGEHAHIGLGAAVMRGITIGRSAQVEAGAVVTEDVGDNVRIGGNPARPIG